MHLSVYVYKNRIVVLNALNISTPNMFSVASFAFFMAHNASEFVYPTQTNMALHNQMVAMMHLVATPLAF